MKEPYRYIFDLLDFADELTGRITADESEKSSYFMTLVYIEDILDKYGRGFVLETARECGEGEEKAFALKNEATKRMDALRATIQKIVQEFDFNQTLDSKAEQFHREWRKRV